MTQATPDRQRVITGGEDGQSNEADTPRTAAARILELIGASVLGCVKRSPPEDKLLARVVGLYKEHARPDLEPADQTGPMDARGAPEVGLAHDPRSRSLDELRVGDRADRVAKEDPPTLEVSPVLISEEVRPHRPSEPIKPSSGATEA